MTKINKNKKEELIKQTNEETDQVKLFVYILIGVAVIAGGLYFITSNYLIKDGVKKDDTVAAEEIAYNNVNVGNVFNRPEDEYYVLAFDSASSRATYYMALMNSYKNDKVRLYYLDLASKMNKAYMGDNSNKEASKPSELSIKDPTLILIKDGKIDKYIEADEEITEELN